MSTLPKEVLRNMINEGNLKTSGDLHSYLKDMFIEEKVISLYSRDMSTRDIHEQIKDIYGI